MVNKHGNNIISRSYRVNYNHVESNNSNERILRTEMSSGVANIITEKRSKKIRQILNYIQYKINNNSNFH